MALRNEQVAVSFKCLRMLIHVSPSDMFCHLIPRPDPGLQQKHNPNTLNIIISNNDKTDDRQKNDAKWHPTRLMRPDWHCNWGIFCESCEMHGCKRCGWFDEESFVGGLIACRRGVELESGPMGHFANSNVEVELCWQGFSENSWNSLVLDDQF